MRKQGLYVHVPFCERKCKYCDFYSVPISGESLPSSYLDGLKSELAVLPDDFSPQTVYIGGGTPTALPATLLKELLRLIACAVHVGDVEEWSCEANPGTVSAEKADILLTGGVNRISLGAQSFIDANLELLGRSHRAEATRESYRLLREAGFRNINLDLMYAIPESSNCELQADLDTLLELDPEHISTYCLTVEENTPMHDLRELGRIVEWDDDEQRAQYDIIRRTLTSAGYRHYEISNLAKAGYECRHNLLYWGPGEYIGCGPAAHSHWGGSRYGNVTDLNAYCRSRADRDDIRVDIEKLDPAAKARETLVMGLRLIDGISREEFRSATGFDYRELKGPEIDELCSKNLLVEEGGRLRLSEEALFISNNVFADLV